MTNLETMVGEMETATKLESDFFNIKVGKNPIRILSDFVKVENIFKGKYPNSVYQGMNYTGRKLAPDEVITMQGWAWIIDRTTGELKIAQFGKGILAQLVSLKNEPDYAYSGFPAPYDVTISNTGEGANRYSILPSRANTPVTEAEMAELNKKKQIKEIVSLIQQKQSAPAQTASAVDYPTETVKSTETNWGGGDAVDDLPM